jgi:undecaprenyl-diphosphatase
VSPVIQAALLGIVQGVTEFLPVSSSAHLILARAFFGFDGDKFGLSFDVACHAGTLIALLIYFRAEVLKMLQALPRLLEPSRDPYAHLVWLLVVGTLPAVAVGLFLNTAIEDHLRTVQVAALTLAVGAVGFFVADAAGRNRREQSSLTMAEAWWLGCAQAVALIPGVSRSGITITVALLMGLRRADAARFIFLLGIPAILAAALHEAPKVITAGLGGETGVLFLIGIAASAVVGYLAIAGFVRYLARRSLAVFAWYRLALAAMVVVWLWQKSV